MLHICELVVRYLLQNKDNVFTDDHPTVKKKKFLTRNVQSIYTKSKWKEFHSKKQVKFIDSEYLSQITGKKLRRIREQSNKQQKEVHVWCVATFFDVSFTCLYCVSLCVFRSICTVDIINLASSIPVADQTTSEYYAGSIQ